MNNHNDFRKIMHEMIMQEALRETLKILSAGKPVQSLKDFEARREEYDPSIETSITDRDMLLWRIDMALDNRDEFAFDLLVRELEGVE